MHIKCVITSKTLFEEAAWCITMVLAKEFRDGAAVQT